MLHCRSSPPGVRVGWPSERCIHDGQGNQGQHKKHTPFFDASGDEAGEVAAFAVLHNDVQCGVGPVYDAVIISHNVWMLQFTQEIDLGHQHLLLALSHCAVVQLLPN